MKTHFLTVIFDMPSSMAFKTTLRQLCSVFYIILRLMFFSGKGQSSLEKERLKQMRTKGSSRLRDLLTASYVRHFISYVLLNRNIIA